MKILAIARSTPFHAGSGGMERVSWDLMLGWAAAGHQVVCLTTPLPTPEPETPVQVVQLPGAPGRYSRNWFSATATWTRKAEADVVLGVSAGAHAVVLNGAAGQAPVLMQAHGTALDELRTRLRSGRPRDAVRAGVMLPDLARDLRAYPGYDAVVAVGSSVPASLAHYPRVGQPRRLEVIVNGVPAGESTARAHHAPQNPPTACFVGRLHREKGADRLLPLLKHWDGRLLVIGDGPLRGDLERRAVSDGLAARVEFAGWLEPDAVAARLRTVDAVVMPSRRREGLPLVALEALAAGAAVVASPTVSATFGPRVPAGVFTAGPDPVAWAAALRKAVAATGAGTVELPSEHHLETAAQRYLDLFEELLQSARGGSNVR